MDPELIFFQSYPRDNFKFYFLGEGEGPRPINSFFFAVGASNAMATFRYCNSLKCKAF